MNQEETEAAAATIINLAPKGFTLKIKLFQTDHPFIFIIRGLKTKILLFIGWILNPL